MPHVSPRKLDEKTLRKIYGFFFSAVSTRGVSKQKQEQAFAELLTPTEKLMLGKRLAAIALLSRNISSYKVGKLLQLSPTTVGRLELDLDKGKLLNIKSLCATQMKKPLERYLDNLLKPLPRYGTSPSSLFKD